MHKGIVVNLSMLGANPTGLGVYSENCARYLEAKMQCTIISSYYNPSSNSVHILSPKSVAIGRGRFAAFKRIAYSLLWRPIHYALVYTPTHHGFVNQQNQIITIHDLIALHHPDQHRFQYYYFKYLIPVMLKHCRAVFTVSETIRREIAETYNYDIDKIFVIPNSVNTNKCYPKSVMCKCSGDPFLLILGASYPHKNIAEFLHMWPTWKGRYKLKIASSRGVYRKHLEQLVKKYNLTENVEFMGYISDEVLLGNLQSCTALVFPSLTEGFGIPPLEAMACGRPVIVSDIPVHREILGDVPIFISPSKPNTWRSAIESLDDARLIESKIEQGKNLVAQYTWEASGKKLLQALLAVEPKLSNLQKV